MIINTVTYFRDMPGRLARAPCALIPPRQRRETIRTVFYLMECERGRFEVKRGGNFILALISFLVAICARGDPCQDPQKKDLKPEEIIQAFAAKETESYEAWIQYTYRQNADVRVVSVNGMPTRDRLILVSEVVFRDDGTREVKSVEKRGGLHNINWTREDTEVINNLQPFALTVKDLPKYNV